MSQSLLLLLLEATWQTILIVVASALAAVIVGIPLGVILLLTRKEHLLEGITIHRSLAAVVNVVRSIPFIILLVLITPFTRLIVGTTIGTLAAIVPLAIAAIPFFARITENALKEVPAGLIEASQAMGATPLEIVIKVLIPEAFPSLIRGLTLMLITLVGYSAMAGAIGGGGLGDVAIRYGYQRFEMDVMLWTVAILVLMVQLLQVIGDRIASRLSH